MKTATIRIVAVAVLLTFAISGPLSAAARRQYRTGHVIAAELSGHGPVPAGKNARPRGRDTWWTYCISAGQQSFSGVGRKSPARMGVAANGEIRFAVEGRYIYLLNSRGERQTLRLSRRSGCRQP